MTRQRRMDLFIKLGTSLFGMEFQHKFVEWTSQLSDTVSIELNEDDMDDLIQENHIDVMNDLLDDINQN